METFPELKEIRRERPSTKYGIPSDDIIVCEHADKKVIFLPRHGSSHGIPPHKIPYKANLAAFKEMGAEYIIGTCVVGSLKKEIVPGSFVLPDQFVNLTWGRDDTYEQDQGFIHLPTGEPYCSHVREHILAFASSTGAKIKPTGTVVIIQGPRFSTTAESKWFSGNGWDIVNMTQYPECYFAKELGLCYSAIASVTDYDAGLQESLVIDPKNADRFLKIFRENVSKTKDLLLGFIDSPFSKLSCKCAKTVVKAYYENI
jgi:5'-methylthioadenosine phosphorylase